MKNLLVAVLLLICTQANALCYMTKENKEMFWVSNLAIFADWQTTLDMRNYPPGVYVERGPIAKALIGISPSKSAITGYFLSRFALNYYLTCNLHTELVHLYLSITTLDHGAAAYNNYNIGLRVRF